MGVIYGLQSKHAEAEKLFKKAVRINPNNSFVHFNLAKALAESGNDIQSIPHHIKATQLAPNEKEAWLNYGKSLHNLGKNINALTCYERAISIDSNYAEAWSNQGVSLNELNRHEEALISFVKALQIDPGLTEAWSNQGASLNELNRHEEALISFERALQINSRLAEAWSSKGNALTKLKRYDEALAAHDQAIRLKPDYAEAWSNKGITLNILQRYDEALECYDRTLKLAPRHARAMSNRALALFDAGRLQEALTACELSLKADPCSARACLGYGNVLKDLKRYPDALTQYARAQQLAPDDPDAYWNESICRLLLGDFERGWIHHGRGWENRLRGDQRPQFRQPTWDGKFVDGTLLAWAEQGIGDQILHAGMLGQASALAKYLRVAAEPRLIPLLQRSFPGVDFVSQAGPISELACDAQVAMGDLGKHLRKGWSDFPEDRIAYLMADPVRALQLRNQLTSEHSFVCGLSWRSVNPKVGKFKTMELAELAPIISIPGIQFVDLQYGDTEVERRQLADTKGLNVEHVKSIDNMYDIDGLAALISACDIVVTISNTTAHLSGALGKTAHVMLPHTSGTHWYWHDERDDSPWYPSIRLVRQTSPNEWRDVIARVAGTLLTARGAPC